MLYVALAAVAALVVTVSLGGGLLRSQQRAHLRERDLLLNQLLNAVGKTWQPPPADTWTMPANPEDGEQAWPRWAGAAEQSEVY